MACNSLTQYSKSCDKAIVAGVAKLYMISFSDLKAVSGSTEVYNTSVNDLVSEIGVASGKTFVHIGTLPKTVAIKDTYAYDKTKGVAQFDGELTLPISNVKAESRAFVKSVSSQPVAALIKLKTGVWIAMGLNGELEVTAMEGLIDGSSNGYTITFTQSSEDFLPIVDPTIVTALIGA